MKNLSLFGCLILCIFFSCSDSNKEDDMAAQEDITAKIIGRWKMDHVRIEGSGCKIKYPGSLDLYEADSVGCVGLSEISGSTQYCVNVELRANGEGTFLWSEVDEEKPDAEITYDINDENKVRYCFVGSLCSDYYALIDGKLEYEEDITFDTDNPCFGYWVLTPN